MYLINEISDGGAETLVKDYALNLDKSLFDVCILTDMESDVYSANYKTLTKNKIKLFCPFFNIQKNSIQGKIFSFIIQTLLFHIPHKWKKKYQFWYIQHKIRKIKPDVIHAHLTVLRYLVPCSKLLCGVKIFYTCHSIPQRYFNFSERKDELEAAETLLKNNSLTLISLHQEMQQELNNLFKINSTIIVHNGIDLDRFYRARKSNQKTFLRENNHIPKDAFVIGNVGRFIWIKNQSFIVDVFLEIIKRKSNSFLLLIGNGDSSEIVKKLSSYGLDSNYSILSNRQDIPELLLCMDVFIFPSFFEGFPLACIEAQAMGLKCVISDSISHDVFLNSNAIPFSLSEPAKNWAETVLDNDVHGPYFGNIEDYDIHEIIKELSSLYKSQLISHYV